MIAYWILTLFLQLYTIDASFLNPLNLNLAPGPVMMNPPASFRNLNGLSGSKKVKREEDNKVVEKRLQIEDSPVRMGLNLVAAGGAVYGGLKLVENYYKHKAKVSESSSIASASKSFEQFTKTFSRSTVTVTQAGPTDSSLVMALGHTTVVNGQTVFVAQTIAPRY